MRGTLTCLPEDPLELRERAVRLCRTAEPKPVIRCVAEELGVQPASP